MSYAEGTSVPVERSRAEIEKVLAKYGADQFVYASATEAALIGFRMKDRMVRFHLPLPFGQQYSSEEGRGKESRRRWRCLLLVIKAKLEAVSSKITTFEEEFYAHILLPGGLTVYEMSHKAIENAYKTQKPPTLLLGFMEEKK